MKRVLPLLFALAATPALAQAYDPQAYDPQAEADRTRAELRQWGAQYDAQAAQAEANQAQAQLTLRRIEAARARPQPGPQAYDPQTAVVTAGQNASAASDRAYDARMRELNAQLAAMDAFLAPPRPR
jgi:uncharacterized protein involved in type VI secretion and phage assembly